MSGRRYLDPGLHLNRGRETVAGAHTESMSETARISGVGGQAESLHPLPLLQHSAFWGEGLRAGTKESTHFTGTDETSWWSSGKESILQGKGHAFNPWSGN